MMGTESVCMLVACLEMWARSNPLRFWFKLCYVLYAGYREYSLSQFRAFFFRSSSSFVIHIPNALNAWWATMSVLCRIRNSPNRIEQNRTKLYDTYTCLLCRYTTLHSYLSLVSSIHPTNQRWQKQQQQQQQKQQSNGNNNDEKSQAKEKNLTSIACIHTTQKSPSNRNGTKRNGNSQQ